MKFLTKQVNSSEIQTKHSALFLPYELKELEGKKNELWKRNIEAPNLQIKEYCSRKLLKS